MFLKISKNFLLCIIAQVTLSLLLILNGMNFILVPLIAVFLVKQKYINNMQCNYI